MRCVLEEAQEEPDVKLLIERSVKEEDGHKEEEDGGGADEGEKNGGGCDTLGRTATTMWEVGTRTATRVCHSSALGTGRYQFALQVMRTSQLSSYPSCFKNFGIFGKCYI